MFFIKLYDLSPHPSSAVLHSVGANIPGRMFFFLAVFPDLNENTGLYNQGNSMWVRFKPQLCNRRADSAFSSEKPSCRVNCLQGWKYVFSFASGLFQQLLNYTEVTARIWEPPRRGWKGFYIVITGCGSLTDELWPHALLNWRNVMDDKSPTYSELLCLQKDKKKAKCSSKAN